MCELFICQLLCRRLTPSQRITTLDDSKRASRQDAQWAVKGMWVWGHLVSEIDEKLFGWEEPIQMDDREKLLRNV